LRPSGLYVVSSTQRSAADDVVGQIIKEMSERVDARRGAVRPRGVTVEEVLGWASSAGFVGTVHELQRQWNSAPADELAAIAYRSWPVLRELDDAAIDEVTRPAVEALRSLPDTDCLRRAVSDLVVFRVFAFEWGERFGTSAAGSARPCDSAAGNRTRNW
jgi:hypothetical protein